MDGGVFVSGSVIIAGFGVVLRTGCEYIDFFLGSYEALDCPRLLFTTRASYFIFRGRRFCVCYLRWNDRIYRSAGDQYRGL